VPTNFAATPFALLQQVDSSVSFSRLLDMDTVNIFLSVHYFIDKYIFSTTILNGSILQFLGTAIYRTQIFHKVM